MVAAVLLGGYLLDEPLPRSVRPIDPDRPAHINAHSQNIPARLWQDPFEIIDDALTLEAAKAKDDAERGLIPTRANANQRSRRFDFLRTDIIQRSEGGLLVLPVTVSGGNYPQAEEGRRRVRYAVVSALIGSGYTPDQPGHIGFFEDPGDGEDRSKETQHPRALRQTIYPYEWFSHDAPAATRSLLVVWVNEDLLGPTPIETMASWQVRLGKMCRKYPPGVRVIGAFGSGTLRAMSREIESWRKKGAEQPGGMDDLVVLSPTATIEERLLAGYERGNTLSERWARAMPRSELVRVTNTDAGLMRALLDELSRRNAYLGKASPDNNPNCFRPDLNCAHVALISESDTLYGRNLPQSFIEAADVNSSDDAGKLGNVHLFSYLRGLDGRIPGAGTKNGPRSNQPTDTTSQRSFGEARIDYLERLAEHLQGLDDQLLHQMRGRLRAVGVLGSDVYDKLLILQSLRHRFPGVVFFTTDLDARLLDRSNFRWTRNLVVVSDFGLQLHDSRQGSVPPFRGSYQTATYLATQMAVGPPPGLAAPLYSAVAPLLSVRRFEIGRDQAFDLATPEREQKPTMTPPRPPWVNGSTSVSLHPPTTTEDQRFHTHLSLWLGLTIGGILLIASMMIGAVQRTAGRLSDIYKHPNRRTLIFTAVLSLYPIVAFGAWLGSDSLGEPFSWTGGVSVWPAEIIRLFAGILAVMLLWRTLCAFEDTIEAIDTEFFSEVKSDGKKKKGATPSNQAAVAGADDTPAVTGQRFLRICELFCFASHPQTGATSKVNAIEQWRLYLDRSRPMVRWARVVLPTALFMAVGYITINVLTSQSPIPVRSSAMLMLDQFIIIGMTVLPFLILLFTVVDSSRSSIALMDALNRPLTQWPETNKGLRYQKIHEQAFSADDLDEWLDVRLGADLTEKLGDIVYFPFLIIFLILASRLTYFDDWTLPFGLLGVIGVSAFYAIYCSVSLQLAARRPRKNALEHLQQRREKAIGK
jgi:hypothetical protein